MATLGDGLAELRLPLLHWSSARVARAGGSQVVKVLTELVQMG